MNLLKNALKLGSTLLIGVAIGAVLYAYVPELYRTADDEPPANLIIVSDKIHTSGQPTNAQLGGLKSAGYELVINLSPPQVFGSLHQEGGLVAQTGLKYVNIPVDWHNPSYEDFKFFSEIMKKSQSRRILVHCQVNKRASLFTFLYRVIYESVEPDEAYENVIKVWAPEPHWLEFAKNILAKKKINYEFL